MRAKSKQMQAKASKGKQMQSNVSKCKQMQSFRRGGLLTRGGALDAADAGQAESECKQMQANVSKRHANVSKSKQM
jgi:hypothetical protein